MRADRQTDKHTDTKIAILRTPPGGEVITIYTIKRDILARYSVDISATVRRLRQSSESSTSSQRLQNT